MSGARTKDVDTLREVVSLKNSEIIENGLLDKLWQVFYVTLKI